MSFGAAISVRQVGPHPKHTIQTPPLQGKPLGELKSSAGAPEPGWEPPLKLSVGSGLKTTHETCSFYMPPWEFRASVTV